MNCYVITREELLFLIIASYFEKVWEVICERRSERRSERRRK